MSRRLVLLRHGQTTYNAERRIQGQLDVPLTDAGHAQARAVAPVLAGLRPSVLWTSDLTRAAATASYVGEACGLEPVADPRLREFHLGERQDITHDDYAARFPTEYAAYAAGRFDVPPGAERASAVAARMSAAARELHAVVPDGGVGVLVSHGAAIREAVASLLDWPGGRAGLLPLGNCHWTVLEAGPDGGRWRLVAHNLHVPAAAPAPERHPDFASRTGVG